MPVDSNPQSKDLFRQLKEGDDTVLDQLKPKLTNYCANLVRNGSVEDVVQEIFMKMWNRREEIDPDRNPKGWMFQIAHNSCIDEWRKAAHRHEEPLNEVNLGESVCSPVTPWFYTLRQILDVLPPDLREALHLRYLEEMTLEEVGRIVGCAPCNVRNRVDKALTILRGHFQEKENR